MSKVMLVEDDKSLREIYSIRLTAEGYEVVSAGDGEEALAIAVKERPDLVVSDVMMPKISGFDMLDILRSTPETANIKVIMMTALSSEDQRQRGESLGADRYLVKSQVGIEDVINAVHEVLGDKGGSAPATTSESSSAPATPEAPSNSESPEISNNPGIASAPEAIVPSSIPEMQSPPVSDNLSSFSTPPANSVNASSSSDLSQPTPFTVPAQPASSVAPSAPAEPAFTAPADFAGAMPAPNLGANPAEVPASAPATPPISPAPGAIVSSPTEIPTPPQPSATGAPSAPSIASPTLATPPTPPAPQSETPPAQLTPPSNPANTSGGIDLETAKKMEQLLADAEN
ncbi:MAG: response regulator [Candidatus Saccharibacteria bacterium]|nr:response regulator [Candidatus Saccharibacteria bacterium]